VNRNPAPANRLAVGVSHGPPNVDDAPNPTSSINTINTFGAPGGGRNGLIGGYDVDGSFASNVVTPTCGGRAIGNTPR
jgi:hypothetical protein